MEVVENKIKTGLTPDELRIGNRFIDVDKSIGEWTLDAYDNYKYPNPTKDDNIPMYEKIEGIEIDFQTAKKLNFKFPVVKKGEKKTGFLFIKANHYYLWRADEPLRIQIKAQFETGKDVGGIKGTLTMSTGIKCVHELQNHMWNLYNGQNLDVSNLLK